MSDSSDSEDSTYQPSPSPPSNASSAASAPPPCGCVYLQSIGRRIRGGSYATTGGDYLEAIFTHREAFFAYPPGHRGCAIGFSELAQDLEGRNLPEGWRADWDGDSEAAAAFRHEAWVIANAF
ncbi:hypothetical protein TRAPUB_12908 [Trametes pubescens]|uniref:Uncharacterized protein n=1 Tax=Trametes pubescens TaxID=154538 RepID=A0A1M2VSU0_TRAPU|nr:hypothetical protein TRAPUB_12908 [Trametes pubescens]